MKAFVFAAKGRLELRELPDAALCSDIAKDRYAAILKPLYISPCSSDVHTVYAGHGPRRDDLILGHEAIAEVTETGDLVRDFAPGDIVAVSAVMPEEGDTAGHAGSPFSACKLGRNMDGLWSERFKVPHADINMAHIPGGLSTQAALMAVDMLPTGATAAEEADIRPGMSVLVIGSGAVGLMAAFHAGRMGAGSVSMIGTDKDRANIDAAAAFKVDRYYSYRDLGLKYGDDGGEGLLMSSFDRVLICGGGQQAFIQACDYARYGGGVIVNVSYIEGEGLIGLPIFSIGRGMSGKTIKFCLSRGGRVWTERMLAEALQAELEGGREASPARLVTHRMSGFENIPEALRLMSERPPGLIKIMLEL